jgi:hypothetical protein
MVWFEGLNRYGNLLIDDLVRCTLDEEHPCTGYRMVVRSSAWNDSEEQLLRR